MMAMAYIIELVPYWKMKDFSVSEIFSSVKCQFVRRCTHSQTIITRLADDFIARYSAKPKPHPQFFKEDVALTHRQLIVYADQCVQVMKKFQFLHIGADIISGVTNSAFRIIDFLAKQLYHHMSQSPLERPKQLEQSLCTSCSRLRENERVRSLREELSMEYWEGSKLMREMVTRRGEKYDEEQLLYESLQNLEALNEQQIRKKLNKMEVDHDKRKKEILVAVEELSRANERVTSYSKALEQSGKEFSGKFNVKDYVFHLGRHFYHNISSLDVRIRQLRQALSSINHQETQTEHTLILSSLHDQIVANLMAEISRIKNMAAQTSRQLAIEQNKNAELQQTNSLLQSRLQESEVAREHQKIEEKISQSHMNSRLSAAQFKIGVLQSMIGKQKGRRAKEQEVVSHEAAHEAPQPQIRVNESGVEIGGQQTCNSSTRPTYQRQSYLVNARTLLRHSQNSKPINQQFTQRLLEAIPSAQQLLTQICEDSKSKLRIYHAFTHSLLPKPIDLHPHIDTAANSGQHLIQDAAEQIIGLKQREVEQMKQKKLSKIYLGRLQFASPTNTKESLYQTTNAIQKMRKKKPSQRKITLTDLKNAYDEKLKSDSKKKLINLKSTGLPSFKGGNDPEGIQKQFDKIDMHKRRRLKKARHLSQQNSYEEYIEYESIKKSLEKVDRQKSPLGENEKHLLLPHQIETEGKILHKKSLHRAEYGRIILSLEEIGYSTYFYSVLADIHLRSAKLYEGVRKFMISLVPGLSDDENSVKDSLNCLIMTHRKCNLGSICSHLQAFLQKVKAL